MRKKLFLAASHFIGLQVLNCIRVDFLKKKYYTHSRFVYNVFFRFAKEKHAIFIQLSYYKGGCFMMSVYDENVVVSEDLDKDSFSSISEESKQNFLKFLNEIKSETANCSVVDHTNHSNHSNW